MPHRKVRSDKPQWGNMTWFELPISQRKVCIEIQQRGKPFRPTPIAIVSQLGRSSVFLFVIDRRRVVTRISTEIAPPFVHFEQESLLVSRNVVVTVEFLPISVSVHF